MEQTKFCSGCNQEKVSDDFNKDASCPTGLQYHCKLCRNKSYRELYKKNPKVYREKRLKSVYGITIAQYDEIFNLQGGRCAICGGLDTGNKNHHKLSVDHDHKTKKVRGLLCHPCNVVLGQAKDNPDILEAAAKYLRK
jgi:hypothetical protein